MLCKKCGCEIPDGGRYCPQCGLDQSEITITLQQIYDKWKLLHRRGITKKTMKGYQDAWQHLKPIANIPTNLLTLENFQSVMDKMLPCSKSYQQKLQLLIGMLCKYSLLIGVGFKTNFAEYLVLDGYESKETLIFEDSEVAKIKEYADDSHNLYYKAARVTLCLIFTGLRPNELFGVTRCEVNIVENYFISKGSKTDAGKNRLIPIIATIKPYITEWYLQTRNANDFLLRGSRGGQYSLQNWRKREFYPLMLELGINTPTQNKETEWRRPYSCRHTFATLGSRAGMDKDVLKKMIGHTDWDFTAARYVHTNIIQIQEESGKIEALACSMF